MALWLQYLLLILGLAFVSALAKEDSEKGSGLALIVMLISSVGILALFLHALTGGA